MFAVPNLWNALPLDIWSAELTNRYSPKTGHGLIEARPKLPNFILVNIVKQTPPSIHQRILLNSFHLNDHTLGFYPQTRKLEPHKLIHGSLFGNDSTNQI